MPRNAAAAPSHVCPGIRIQAIDIVQPPGIGIPPIADMDAHETMVNVALVTQRSAEMPKKARREVLSEAMPPISSQLLRVISSHVEPHLPTASMRIISAPSFFRSALSI